MGPIGRAAITYAAYFTAVGASWAYLPIYYREIGLGLAAIGILTALSAGVQLVTAPGWGAIADRFPRSRLSLAAAGLVAAAGAAALGLAGPAATIMAIAVAVAVLSIGLGGIAPVLDARTLDLLGPRPGRYGQVRAVGSIAFIVASVLVGFALDRTSTGVLFAAYVPALVVTGLVSLAIPRGGGGRRHALVSGLGTFLRAPGVLLFLAGALLTWLTLNAVNVFYSIQVVALGGNAQLAGLVWVVGAVVEIPIMWTYARLAAVAGAGSLLVIGALAFAARSALAAISPDATWLVAISPLQGIGYGLFLVGGVSFVAGRAPTGLEATAQGVLAATIGLATILGSGLGGVVAGASSIPTLFALAAAGGACAAGIVALAARSSTRAGAQPASPPGTPPLTPEEVRP
ncbi:MAG: major facilitator superfamily transporter [Chloroflexi bacterium]|nr:major facilitator superfamily transporter [Chloroflexota bacterium]